MVQRVTQGLSFAGQFLAALLISATASSAQSTATQPPTQDDQLRRLLGLGDAVGCRELLFPSLTPTQRAALVQDDVARELVRLGTQLGKELRAICGPSAVNSASSLGGGLGSAGATRTATQFGATQSRPNKRVQSGSRGKPSTSLRTLMYDQIVPSPALASTSELAGGVGLFVALDFDQRDRNDTPFESAYESDVRELTGGVDYVRGQGIVGGFAGRSTQEADFTQFGPILPNNLARDAFGILLRQPQVLTTVCGGLSNAGTFEQSATRVGGFAGWGVGGPGFVDATFAWTRREQDYSRNICVIEGQGTLEFVNGQLRDAGATSNVVDDIYAGTLTANTTTRETSFSVRTGANLGNDTIVISPRVRFATTRAKTDAFSETGSSTVDNTVTAVDTDPRLLPIQRTLRGPIGLELAFDEQSRTSVVFEAGAEIGVRFGPIVPHAWGFWRREFKDDFHVVSARFVQDLRPTPTTFDIGNDPYDRDSLISGFGLTAIGGDHFVARVEIAKLHADELFNSRTVSFQARVRF